MNADNVVVLNGRLTKDVDVRQGNNGNSYCLFTIAVNRSYTESAGNRPADFHNCVASGKTAELISTYFKKGDMIGIFGELRDNNYEKDGVMHYNKQIRVDSIGFRDNRNNQQNTADNQQNTADNQQNSMNKSTNQFTNNNNTFEANNDAVDIQDDDLPF